MWPDVPLSIISLFSSFSYGTSWEKKTTRNLAYASKPLRWHRWTLPEQRPSRLGDIASIGVPWVTAFKANSLYRLGLVHGTCPLQNVMGDTWVCFRCNGTFKSSCAYGCGGWAQSDLRWLYVGKPMCQTWPLSLMSLEPLRQAKRYAKCLTKVRDVDYFHYNISCLSVILIDLVTISTGKHQQTLTSMSWFRKSPILNAIVGSTPKPRYSTPCCWHIFAKCPPCHRCAESSSKLELKGCLTATNLQILILILILIIIIIIIITIIFYITSPLLLNHNRLQRQGISWL